MLSFHFTFSKAESMLWSISDQMLHNAENKVLFVLLMSEGEHAAVTEVQDLIITQFWVMVPDFWPLERAAKNKCSHFCNFL